MLCLLEGLPRFRDLKFEILNIQFPVEGISRQIRAWANSLQNPDIKGQRYLTEETRRIAESARRSKAFMEQLGRIAEDGRHAPRDVTGDGPDATEGGDS
jgi:hypothetical protein